MREVQEGEEVCVHVADSLCYTAETNATLQSKYIPIIKKKKYYRMLEGVMTHMPPAS